MRLVGLAKQPDGRTKNRTNPHSSGQKHVAFCFIAGNETTPFPAKRRVI
jgi:hypothetical protein